MKVEQELASVEVGDRVASGGTSTVFDVLGHRDTVLFKRFTAPRERVELDDLAGRFAAFDGPAREYARAHLAWPVTVVHQDGAAAGALVLRAPEGFYLPVRGRVRDLNFLLYEQRAARIGVAPTTDRQKVDLLRELVDVLAWLDDRGLVHEDLSAHNVLWRVDPVGVFLLDCDSLRPAAASSTQPLMTTVDWTDPRLLRREIRRPDRASTSVLLGLVVPRVLVSPDWHPGDPLPTDRVPRALAALVARSGTDNRPTLTEWGSTLAGSSTLVADQVTDRAVTEEPVARQSGDQWAFAVGVLLGVALALYLLLGWV